ncbi:conserved hypothetical protein [Talaromyces stipitatus ATCC 10500]|uniref:DUF1740-domain-containing protein n=1 Tax=Talaromyces stipitatus (strain ATCC 10500 / CBS 375.48 / QM 6759 / NRRL 1006) TaxID=441959 RepID=B8LZ62_TALSN|nr:uncharacterized protein TSTA_083380 [Talaromyces stipitatus ATCC 10500]EED21106.1 conserved hypothetical protein [Talaromyces stipitatus ATCC 10500]
MQEAKSVPKFASFKAKPAPPTEDVKKSRRLDDGEQDERRRHRSKHHRHHHRSHSRDRHHRRKSEGPTRDASPPPQTKEESQDFYKIDHTKEGNVFRVRQNLVTDNTDDAVQSFIPLSHDGSRKRRKMSGGYVSDVSDETEKYGYRSIYGKAKPEVDIPSDMEASLESDTDEEGGTVKWDREANKRNSELLSRAEDDPGDVDAWLEVIKYQDTLLLGSGSTRQLTAAEKRNLADIKLSLYEKALKKVGKKHGKDRLLLGYLEEGASLWESKRLAEQWHAVLQHNPGYINLWVRYIDFRQTEFLNFTFERCKNVYLECMALNASTTQNTEQELIHVYLFLRMTLFMREAGYSELAVGLWQAVLEMTLFCPDRYLNSSKADILDGFASFWESEVARIGEPGAKGWSSNKSSESDTVENDAKTRIDSETLFSSWSIEERRLSRSARLPARTVDIVENDDPFRVVLWSDIEPFLSYFASWKDKGILVHDFLEFCCLPSLHQTPTSASGGTPFLRTELVHLPDASILRMIKADPNEAAQPDSTVYDMAPLQNMIHSVDTLFAGGDWFQSMTLWKQISKNKETTIDVQWVQRSLRLLVGAASHDDELAERALAVEYAMDPNEGEKYAKALLKKRSSSLRLYNAFALMKSRSGNFSIASHVWATTFSMAANLSQAQRLEYGTLIRSWVWEYLVSGNEESAIQVLTSIPSFTINVEVLQQPGQSDMSSAQFLKTEEFLMECSARSRSLQDLAPFIAWTDLTALLHYLFNSFDLSSTLRVYRMEFNQLKSSSLVSESFKFCALESLHQSRSRLLYHHITAKRAYKPAAIRELLVESTTLFPHNTMLLSLFSWNESRFRVDERIRSAFASQQRNPTETPITSSLLTILTELTRPIYTGSTIHSVRAAFERALQPSSSNAAATPSPSLWKLYILFELYRAKDINATNKVFYRAMRACPWSKDILMLAFPTSNENDGSVVVDDWWELHRIYNVLLDKELRVHVEIDDATFEEGERKWVEREHERGLEHVQGGRRRRKKDVVYLPDDPDTE